MQSGKSIDDAAKSVPHPGPFVTAVTVGYAALRRASIGLMDRGAAALFCFAGFRASVRR
jgi:hypothetical protein